MQAVTRLGDKCTGHDGFPPRENDTASGDVFANGIGIHRVGDHWVTHCDITSCHDSIISTGSSTVFVNGKPIIRIGDQIDCGSVVAEGSQNVFSG